MPWFPTQEVVLVMRALIAKHRGVSALVCNRFMTAVAQAQVTLFKLVLCKVPPQIQLMDVHNEPQWPCNDGSGAL